MIDSLSKIVIDLDNTLTIHDKNRPYAEQKPNIQVIEKLRQLRKSGYQVCIYTARNMRTHNCNTARISAETLPGIIAWLQEHDVPYDEIQIGKPWCGPSGFYVDDKAIRPSEFTEMTIQEIFEVIG